MYMQDASRRHQHLQTTVLVGTLISIIDPSVSITIYMYRCTCMLQVKIKFRFKFFNLG